VAVDAAARSRKGTDRTKEERRSGAPLSFASESLLLSVRSRRGDAPETCSSRIDNKRARWSPGGVGTRRGHPGVSSARGRRPLADVRDVGPDLQALRLAADVRGRSATLGFRVRTSQLPEPLRREVLDYLSATSEERARLIGELTQRNAGMADLLATSRPTTLSDSSRLAAPDRWSPLRWRRPISL
jgi:hypothetical protein